MTTLTAAKSIQGTRPYQQDSWAHLTLGAMEVIAVADGNGGNGGAELSNAAVASIFTGLVCELSQGQSLGVGTVDELRDLGLQTIRQAAAHVAHAKRMDTEWQDAGTTITLAIVTAHHIGVFWIGDSPAVLYHAGCIEHLVSPPHTLLELLVAEGQPRESLSLQQGLSSTLVRCAGHACCEPDYRIVRLRGLSIVIAGSDGLFGFVPPEQLTSHIRKAFATCASPAELANSLVELAVANNTDDNVTTVVSLVSPGRSVKQTKRRATKLNERQGADA